MNLDYLYQKSFFTRSVSLLFVFFLVGECYLLWEMSSTNYLYTILILNLAFSIPIFGHYWIHALKKEPMTKYKKEKEISALIYLAATILSGLAIVLSQLVGSSSMTLLSLHDLIKNPVLFAIVGLLLVDALFYLYHRLSHQTSLGWLFHSSHHSIEHMEYENSVRIDLKDFNPIYWVTIALPMGLLGFNAFETYVLVLTSLYYQYFLHSGANWFKDSFWGYIFNHPSLHRVHHSLHQEQLDKNYGGIVSTYDYIFRSSSKETRQLIVGDFGLKGVSNSATLEGTYLSFTIPFLFVVRRKPWLILAAPQRVMDEYQSLGAGPETRRDMPRAS